MNLKLTAHSKFPIVRTRPARKGKSLCLNFAAAAFLGLAIGKASAQSITPGNLIVERMGDGSAALSSASTAVFLNQYTTAGVAGTVITIPTSGAAQLANSGSAGSEGLITVSPNGLVLNIAGYNAAPGVASIVSTASSANARVVDFITADGTVSRAGSTSTAFGANNIRGAISNGTDVWAVGANTGVVDLTNGNTVSVPANGANNRAMGIFAGAAGGQLYFSTGAGTTRGIYVVGSGLPTGTGVTSTNLISTGGSSSPYSFSFNTAMTVAYVADSAAGITKYTSSNGTTWTAGGTYANTLTGSAGTTGLTVDWSNPSSPTLYASSPTNLYTLADTGGTGSASFGTATSLATAANNTAFRGVQFALLPSVWTNNNGNASGSLNLATAAAATQYSNFSTILANDSNLAFQNVNTGVGGTLALSLNNNTTLTSASSINFQAGGFGTNAANTSYTLTGSGLTLSGTASTSALGTFTANSTTYTTVLANNSGVTQTVNIPLTLGAANQAFRAASGDLNINGTVNNNGNTLTVGGASNTSFGSSAVISGSGGLTKVESGTATLGAASNYTGTTTVSVGTLAITGSAKSTSGVTVNTGGTLLMSSSTGASNIVGTGTVVPTAGTQTFTSGTVGTTAVTLGSGGGGGTLAVAGSQSGTTHSFASLALGANSILDFGSGNTGVNLVFGGSPSLSGNTLTINNWNGPDYSGQTTDIGTFGGTQDRLLFTTDPSNGHLGMALTGISFNGTAPGMAVSFGSYYEIVPVPEPTTVLGAAGLLGFVGYRERKRVRGVWVGHIVPALSFLGSLVSRAWRRATKRPTPTA